MDRPIVIWGAGGHARVVAEALTGRDIAGHVSAHRSDPNPIIGPYLGSDQGLDALAADYDVVVGFAFVDAAGAAARRDAVRRADSWNLISVVHPQAEVSPTALINAGAVVCTRAIVGTQASIGRAAVINTGAIVDHDTTIGVNCHIGPGAVLSGGVTVGPNTLVGVGATVIQGVTIGANAVIGAGAVVVDDVADNETTVAAPARTIS